MPTATIGTRLTATSPSLQDSSRSRFTEAGLWSFFLAEMAVICGTTAFTGAVPTSICGHDIFLALENGWRVVNGQRPHVDFLNPWGALWGLISANGLMLSHYSVEGIGYASAGVALIIGLWSFVLAKQTLAPLTCLMLSGSLAILAAAPYPLGCSPFALSHAMAYNRYGYALLGIAFLESFVVKGSARSRQIGGFSTGAALGLVLFLKVSFFVVGLILVVSICCIERRVDWRRWIGLGLGFSTVSALLMGYLHFNLPAMFADLLSVSHARLHAINLKSESVDYFNRGIVAVAAILLGFAGSLLFRDKFPRWNGVKLPILATIVFCADELLIASNAQLGGFPLCAVFAMLVVGLMLQHSSDIAKTGTVTQQGAGLAVLLLGAILFIPQAGTDLMGVAYGAARKAELRSDTKVLRFSEPALRPLVLEGKPERSNGSTFVQYVNDGVALLQRESRPSETILTMDMTNPFPYALGRRPSRGGILSPMYRFNIDGAHRPSDERFFGDADIVMVPKRPSSEDVYYIGFYKAYESGLRERFRLAAEDDWWWMYRRK